jgi:epoxyqueuosine reductase
MERAGRKAITNGIVEKAKELGTCLAGIADVSELRRSPSHVISSKLDSFRGIGTKESKGTAPGVFTWPKRARSIIVLAVPHPSIKPELDWWMEGCRGGTPGNQMLIAISDRLSEWLKEKKGVETKKLPYYIEQGGVYLKDAAAMAGLGCIGKNNLFLTPEFGPRVRLRALFAHFKLPSTGPLKFDPCKECDMPCREVCPQGAFRSKRYSQDQMELADLPGRDGVYNRHLCNVQMELDVAKSERTAAEGGEKAVRVVRYCRRCELACPVGKRAIDQQRER